MLMLMYDIITLRWTATNGRVGASFDVIGGSSLTVLTPPPSSYASSSFSSCSFTSSIYSTSCSPVAI